MGLTLRKVHYLVIGGLVWLNTLDAQQLHFRGFPVDSITIRSSSGYYHFDDKGTTTGQTDLYLIAYDKTLKNYIVTDYHTVLTKNTYHPETSEQKVQHHLKDRNQTKLNTPLEGLFTALASKSETPTYTNLGFQKEKFFSSTGKKQIRRVAKRYKQDWQFKLKYTTREDNEILYTGCQNIDTFNLFLSKEFENFGYPIITDVWDVFSIRLKTVYSIFLFEGKYPNVLKQPWYDHSDTSKLFPTPILNFRINKNLIDILPDKFHRIKSLTNENLLSAYVKWYLVRREIISEF